MQHALVLEVTMHRIHMHVTVALSGETPQRQPPTPKNRPSDRHETLDLPMPS